MRRRFAATAILLAVAAGAVFMAFWSYGGIESKLNLATSAQETMRSMEEGAEDGSLETSLQASSVSGGERQESSAEDGSSAEGTQDAAAGEGLSEDGGALAGSQATGEEEAGELEEPVEVNPEAPVLTLKSSRVEITVGDPFNVVSQVEEITDDSDDRYRLFRHISVHGTYDTDTAGEYVLEYVVTDRDGNSSIPKNLTLIVREKTE